MFTHLLYLPEHYWTLDYVFPSSHDKYYLPYSSASNSSIKSTHVYTYQLYSPVVFSILSSFILCHHPPLPGSIDIPASQAHILFALQFLTSCEVYAMCPLGKFFLSLSSLGPSSLSAHELGSWDGFCVCSTALLNYVPPKHQQMGQCNASQFITKLRFPEIMETSIV